jgi:predicted DNA-binding protein (MmcQ/YjbR family)
VDLRALAMSLPGAWEDNPFGHATPLVKVGPKIFAFLSAETLTVKVDPDRGEALRGTYPGVVTVAPYLSKRHWVAIRLGAGLDPDEVADLLRRSHALVVAGLPRRDRPGVD